MDDRGRLPGARGTVRGPHEFSGQSIEGADTSCGVNDWETSFTRGPGRLFERRLDQRFDFGGLVRARFASTGSEAIRETLDHVILRTRDGRSSRCWQG